MYKRESDDISTEYGLMEEKCVELDSIFHLPGEGGNDSSREVFYQHAQGKPIYADIAIHNRVASCRNW